MNRAHLRGLVPALLLLLVACSPQPRQDLPPDKLDKGARAGGPRLPAAPRLADAAPVRLGAVTKRAAQITSGHSLVAGAGHLLTFSLGHVSGPPRTVTVTGAKMPPVTVPPGVWQRVQVWADAPDIALHFEGGPLYLAQPHLFDPNSDKVPNILLISVDTLRADHFDAAHMPRTSALFAQGTVFDRAYTPTTWTLPAHTSLLTGRYPAMHGVRTPDKKLPEDVTTLAEHLREIGYYTAGFTEGNYVSAVYGLDQGFLHYHENPPSLLEHGPEQVSKLASTLDALRRHKRDLGDLPRFYFLHTYEVHCPYVPRGGLADPEGVGDTQWLLDHDGKDVSPQQLALLKQLYAGEVAYADAQLADLITEVTAEGNWLVVLTADHGEEFGEHGGLLHAHTTYEETARVPLAFVGAPIPAARSAEPVSLVDVAPTLLSLLGLAVPDGYQGHALLGTEAAPRPVYAESFYFGVHLPVEDPMTAAVWQNDHKLIHNRNFAQNEIAVYDLAADPAETHNLAAEDVRRRNALYGLLQAYLALKPGEVPKLDNLSQEQIEAMRSLGYLK